MKISAGASDRFVAKPDPAVVAVLLYGPDRGLVQERAERLAKTVVETLDDPFRVVDLNASVLVSDPARLADEAAAQSLMGGRRVVRVRAAGNDLGLSAGVYRFAGIDEIPVWIGEIRGRTDTSIGLGGATSIRVRIELAAGTDRVLSPWMRAGVRVGGGVQ